MLTFAWFVHDPCSSFIHNLALSRCLYASLFKDFAWMFGLVTSCASLIILIVNGCDLVIWLTTLLGACRALTFHLAMLYLTCSVAFIAYDLP